MATHILQTSNIARLSKVQRVKFLLALHAYARQKLQHEFATAMQEYRKVCDDVQDSMDGVKLQVLKEAAIVGFTVTGGAIFSRLISALKPPIIIVEEAGRNTCGSFLLILLLTVA